MDISPIDFRSDCAQPNMASPLLVATTIDVESDVACEGGNRNRYVARMTITAPPPVNMIDVTNNPTFAAKKAMSHHRNSLKID